MPKEITIEQGDEITVTYKRKGKRYGESIKVKLNKEVKERFKEKLEEDNIKMADFIRDKIDIYISE